MNSLFSLRIFYLFLFALLLQSWSYVYAQNTPIKKKGSATSTTPLTPTTPISAKDSTISDTTTQRTKPSLTLSTDSTTMKLSDSSAARSSSGIDSVVTYYAKDSVVFIAKQKRMRLRGDANAHYKTQKLESEVIEIFFENGLMNSESAKDSSGRAIGYPKFTDGGKEYVGETIKYNFKNKAGTVSLGETTIDNGFFFGTRIKRTPDEALYVENGCYTTCDHPHPHFYFSSPKMKLIPGERVFFQDLYLYVQDIPVFYLPFGLFFPNKGGRQSGLLVPEFRTDANLGVVFQRLGYYFALSDYTDLQSTVDIFSKGGIQWNNSFRYKLLYVLNGDVSLSYNYTRPSPKDEFGSLYKVELTHAQTFSPSTSASARLSFQSDDFNKRSAATLAQRIQQNISSNASISHNFDNGMVTTLSYIRNQDVVNKTYSQTPSLSLTIPTLFPLKNAISGNSWLRDISFSMSANASVNDAIEKQTADRWVVLNDTLRRVQDSLTVHRYPTTISYTPSINVAPKLGFFSVSPSISFGGNVYLRRTTRSYDSALQRTKDNIENGFFNEFRYSAGLTVGTTLYGIAKPGFWGINAVRHTVQPRVSINYSPNLSNANNNASYEIPFDTLRTSRDTLILRGRTERYSRYVLDGGGVVQNRESWGISYSLGNSIDMKVRNGDSAEKNVELLRWDFSGSYDPKKDSLKFSGISSSFRTPSIGIFNFNGGASFTLYKEALVPRDRDTGYVPSSINTYTFRMTGINFTLSGSISPATFGITTQTATSAGEQKDTVKNGLGERFRRRVEYQDSLSDIYGDNTPGWQAPAYPWDIRFTFTYSHSKPSIFQEAINRFDIQTGVNFNLTPTWNISTSFNYDATNKAIQIPTISITKQIHCWALSMDWQPTGVYSGFYLRFAATDALLRDLKIEKRSSPNFR